MYARRRVRAREIDDGDRAEAAALTNPYEVLKPGLRSFAPPILAAPHRAFVGAQRMNGSSFMGWAA